MGTRISDLPEDATANDLDVFPVVDQATNVTKKVKVSTLTTAVLNAGSANGQGVPSGGTTGQVLSKSSNTNYATQWSTVSGTGDALTANPLSQFAATTSLQLKDTISDETGSGALVFATSPTLVTPALGTPASGVATNLTGTASGLTAGNVTTNANLTGPITSVGNATSIASQTGTGTKFVVDTSPVLVTPNLGTPSAGTLTNCTFPTLNQNTTGSAAKWTTARNIAGNSVDGSANATFANKFIVQGTTDAGLTAAQFLGALGTGMVKNTTTTGVLSIAASGTDYAPATSGSAILKGNGAGGFSNAAASTDYIAATTGSAVQKASSGGLTAATAGTDFTSPTSTETMTNKRITKRTGTTTSSATPTINTDNVDFYSITALAAAITSFTTNLSGTPTDGQTLWIAITDNGTARAITWGASFQASTVALPTTTVISTRLDVGFIWNASVWRCIAVA